MPVMKMWQYKLKRKVKKYVRASGRVARRTARRGLKKSVRRTKKLVKFSRRLSRSGPKRMMKRWVKRKVRGKRTVRLASREFRDTHVRRGGRHDIVPGRTIVEWLPNPYMGRGRVLAYLPGNMLDVEFDQGGRPVNGIRIEEVRVLA